MHPLESIKTNTQAIHGLAEQMQRLNCREQLAWAEDAGHDPARLEAILHRCDSIQNDVKEALQLYEMQLARQITLKRVLENMVQDIINDPRYSQPCNWQNNIYLYSMQVEWKAKVNIMKQVLAQLNQDTVAQGNPQHGRVRCGTCARLVQLQQEGMSLGPCPGQYVCLLDLLQGKAVVKNTTDYHTMGCHIRKPEQGVQ
jgi:hypothetical protein